MLADLPLVDQVWNFSLVIAFIVGCLVVLVLMGPAFVRDVVGIFRVDHDGPGPTDPDVHGWLALKPSEHVGVDLADQEVQ